MTDAPPMIFSWDGTAMVPRHPRLADKHFIVGEVYRLEAHKERSVREHNFYFASIASAWQNLPEDQAERWPTAEHLRKWCLIKAGFCDERSIVCASAAEAQRIGAFVKPMDTYALVTVSGACVRVYTAQSQSRKAMGAKDFQASKQAVLEIASSLIGTSTGALASNAGKAA